MTDASAPPPKGPIRAATFGLSLRVLGLVVVAVMVAEVAVFLPSIARFRLTYLHELIETGALAALSLEATPDNMVDEKLTRTLLDHARVDAVFVERPGQPLRSLAPATPLPDPDATVELFAPRAATLIWDALAAMARSGPWLLKVGGESMRMPGERVWICIDEQPMRIAMYGYAQRILGLSLIIAGVTAAILYLGLRWLIVRPLQAVAADMTRFRRAPEDEASGRAAVRRNDELGIVDREFAILQRELREALRQKTRLADLGAGVGKINHDLRNMLATAQLLTDRLAHSSDPKVRESAPIMAQSIDRAAKLCGDTLDWVRGRSRPKLQPVDLADLVDQVGVDLLETIEEREPQRVPRWDNRIDPGLAAQADRDHLYRVFANLGRNAFEAGARAVTIAAERGPDVLLVDVIDDGPGVPERIEMLLFRPFAGSTRSGGSGLGLAIARDLVRAHGGDITLLRNGADGATFRFTLPMR